MDEWEDVSHVLEELNKVPTTGFIYRLIDKDDEVIYVGQTKQPIARRLAGHAADKEWFTHIAKVEVREVPLEKLDFMEGVEIHAHHPWGNRVCPLTINGLRMCKFYTSGESSIIHNTEEELAVILAAIEAKRARALQKLPAAPFFPS